MLFHCNAFEFGTGLPHVVTNGSIAEQCHSCLKEHGSIFKHFNQLAIEMLKRWENATRIGLDIKYVSGEKIISVVQISQGKAVAISPIIEEE